MIDPIGRQTVIEDLAAMSEAEFLDTVAKARGGGKDNAQTKKEAAAEAFRQWHTGPVRSD